jgi:hypothetical protein
MLKKLENHLDLKYFILIIILAIIIYYYYWGSYENFVNNKKTPVITLYYASWCSACAEFRPIWDNFKKQSNINIKEEDCSGNNSCPNIPGFPTIILTNSSGQNITYTGDRTVQDLLDFVSSN